MNAMQNGYTFLPTDFGQIPSDWGLCTIGSLGKVVTGSTPSTNRADYYGGPYMFVSPADLGGRRYITSTEKSLTHDGISAARALPARSVLVSCIGYIGKTGLTADEQCATNQQINAILCVDGVDAEFVYHLMGFLAPFIASRARMTTVPIISKGVFESLPIPVPPLHEQRRIAAVLNTIQDAIAAQEDVIAAAKEFKRSLMHRLFTVGSDREPAPTKETEIGQIPAHWRMAQIQDVLEIKLGKMLSQVAMTGAHARPYLRNANVQWGRVDIDDLAEMDFLPEERHKYLLRDGDILVCEGGEIGRTALWESQIGECYYQKAIHRLRPLAGAEIMPRFFLDYMVMLFLIRSVPIVEGARSTIAHLPVAKLKVLPLALPPLAEQANIVEMTGAADAKIAAEEDRLSALQALFKSMLHQLMTGQIRLLSDEGLPLA